MLSPTGVSVEPDTSNPTWGAGGEPPPPPALGLPPLLGVGGLRARLSATEMLQKEELRRVRHGAGAAPAGGGGGSHLSFLGLSGPFLQGRCRRSGLAPPSPHPISPYLVTPPGPRGLSCRESEPFPKPPPGDCTPGAGSALPGPTSARYTPSPGKEHPSQRSLSGPDPRRQREGQCPVVCRPPHPPLPSEKRGWRQ